MCGIGEPMQDIALILAPVIEHDAFLTAIDTQENGACAVDKRRANLAGIIAPGRFDLNHLGAGVSKLHRAERAANPFREIDHTHADIWMGAPKVLSVDLGEPIPEEMFARLQDQPEVDRTECYMQGFSYWSKPGGGRELCMIIGSHLGDDSLGRVDELNPDLRSRLSEPGSVVVDDSDGPRCVHPSQLLAWDSDVGHGRDADVVPFPGIDRF